ncbi:MAG: protease modulator HflC [Caulobacteraceae bacterium]
MNTSNNLNHSSKKMLIDTLVKKLLILFLFIALVAVVVTNTLIVQEDELVVVKQFGRVEKILDKPGMYFKLPFIQNTQSLTKKLMDYETQPVKVFSKDKRNLVVTNYTLWRITDPHSFIENIETIGSAEMMIDSAVYSAVRQEYSDLTYDEIISGSTSGKDFNSIVTGNVKKELGSTGIEVLDVRLCRTDLPVEEEEAVYSKIKTDREKIAKQYISMAENETTQIKAEADKQAKIIISKANASAEEIKGKADAEAARIYAESYNQDPEFYKFVRTLESYKKTLKGKTTIILPIDSPYTKYLIGK